jgi:hypothetical protein
VKIVIAHETLPGASKGFLEPSVHTQASYVSPSTNDEDPGVHSTQNPYGSLYMPVLHTQSARLIDDIVNVVVFIGH